MPGHTLGGVLLARYLRGSTLSYRELLVACALVRSRRRVGLWIAYAGVDSPASAAAGRALWGLPKQLASFADDPPAVAVDGSPVLRLRAPRPRPALPVPLLAPVFGRREDGEVWTAGLGIAALGAGPAELQVEAESPLAALELRPAAFALAGRARVFLPAARRLTAEGDLPPRGSD